MRNKQIEVLEFDTLKYRQSLSLRNEILRKPIGMSIYDDDLSDEKSQVHIAYLIADDVVGILLLKQISENEVKMRQVAVKKDYQNQGIGAALVEFAEEIARNSGYHMISLHARKTAVSFYEKLSYIRKSEEFLEVGIPHYKMEKEI
ncbi:MAG: GNAT family N-acetyltransferase [Saccharofermentanales bacterium]